MTQTEMTGSIPERKGVPEPEQAQYGGEVWSMRTLGRVVVDEDDSILLHVWFTRNHRHGKIEISTILKRGQEKKMRTSLEIT